MNTVTISCAEMNELAPEFVLGILSADERAAVLQHLASCLRCSTSVDELAAVTDQLLELTPATEPPLGFETTVLGQIKSQTNRQRAPRSKWLWSAAAALFLLAITGVSSFALHHSDQPVAAPIRTAFLSGDNGKFTCSTVIRPGNPGHMTVNIDEAKRATETYLVKVQLANATVSAGSVHVRNGNGTLSMTTNFDSNQARKIEVLDASGHLRYAAEFKNS